jgi:hypothetical protein
LPEFMPQRSLTFGAFCLFGLNLLPQN